jgi:hypothetical protein
MVLEGNDTSSSRPFDYYQRLSVERDSWEAYLNRNIPGKEYFAIDVDIRHQVYRVMHLNTSDTENEFLAHGYKTIPLYLPTFHPLSEEIVSNGTFTKTNSTYKHMHIQPLNIAIANMYDFVNSCEQEPFIKVYQNMDSFWGESESRDRKFQAILNEPWDTKKVMPEEYELVMRTASFGHGRQRLDMCIQEEFGEDDGKLVSAGVFEDMFVPFAIMAASRRRAYETNSKVDNC